MIPEEDGRPVSKDQWAALELIIANGGRAWLVKSKTGRHSVTNKMAKALADRGLATVEGNSCYITEAGTRAVEVHRNTTGRHPQ